MSNTVTRERRPTSRGPGRSRPDWNRRVTPPRGSKTVGVWAKKTLLPFLMRSTPTENGRTSGTGSLTLTKPSNCNVGDRLFIYGHKATSTGAFTAPSGFTLVDANAAGSDRAHLWTRVVDGTEGSTFSGPSLDVSAPTIEFVFVYPPCTIEQATNLAATAATTIVGDDFTTNPSAAATILGCGGTNDDSTPYAATSTPAGVIDAEHTVTGVSAYIMHVASVTVAPGASVWQGANRNISTSAQKGAVCCYLVPTP